MKKNRFWIALHVVALAFSSPFGFAGNQDIIPGEKKFPGRYIGTPIIKKNGQDHIQFQDCSVIKDAKNPQARCRTIVEVPSDVLVKYMKCKSEWLQGERDWTNITGLVGLLVLGGGYLAGMTPAAPAAPVLIGIGTNVMAMTAVGGGMAMYDQKKWNVQMQEEKLTRNIDHTTDESAEELVERIGNLYNEITSSGCFSKSEIGKVRSQIKLYGNQGPKTTVALKTQKFYSLTGIQAQPAPKPEGSGATEASSQAR